MALKFYTSVAKELKLKVRKFLRLILKFVEVTGEKLVCVCVYVCMCVRLFTVKASSVWISWSTKEQINDVVLKTYVEDVPSAKSLHRYFRMKLRAF